MPAKALVGVGLILFLVMQNM